MHLHKWSGWSIPESYAYGYIQFRKCTKCSKAGYRVVI